MKTLAAASSSSNPSSHESSTPRHLTPSATMSFDTTAIHTPSPPHEHHPAYFVPLSLIHIFFPITCSCSLLAGLSRRPVHSLCLELLA